MSEMETSEKLPTNMAEFEVFLKDLIDDLDEDIKEHPSLAMQQEEKLEVHNLWSWIDDNKEQTFKPLIRSKLMFSKQLNVMFLGGPNTRKDYHIDCGEEFFYQIKGNIHLPTRQKGVKKVVNIKEGQVYLLPPRVPRSPQRPEKGSLGLVVERQPVKGYEMDCLRYYVNDFDVNEQDPNKVLWEKWFHCYDLGAQLPPVAKEFYESVECKTGVRQSKLLPPPHKVNINADIPEPFDLYEFIEKNKDILEEKKQLDVFKSPQTTVRIFGQGTNIRKRYDFETLIYCLKGEKVRITFEPPSERGMAFLVEGDFLIIRKSEPYQIIINNEEEETLVMSITMANKKQREIAREMARGKL